eukprot:scaffold1503_cov120-Isochrysis_galbana.AAC.5
MDAGPFVVRLRQRGRGALLPQRLGPAAVSAAAARADPPHAQLEGRRRGWPALAARLGAARRQPGLRLRLQGGHDAAHRPRGRPARHARPHRPEVHSLRRLGDAARAGAAAVAPPLARGRRRAHGHDRIHKSLGQGGSWLGLGPDLPCHRGEADSAGGWRGGGRRSTRRSASPEERKTCPPTLRARRMNARLSLRIFVAVAAVRPAVAGSARHAPQT